MRRSGNEEQRIELVKGDITSLEVDALSMQPTILFLAEVVLTVRFTVLQDLIFWLNARN